MGRRIVGLSGECFRVIARQDGQTAGQTGSPFDSLGFDWPFSSLGIDWPLGVLGGYVLVILAFTTPDRRRVYIWTKTVNELVVYKTTPRPIFCARRLISSHGVPQKD